jgi:predicted alpha-1,2-mannosidase
MPAPRLSLILGVLALPAVARAQSLVSTVDPFIGTDDSRSPDPVPGGAGGSTFPGASAPFGMIQWSPDTPTASPSGFRYKDSTIEGFSLTHFDGAGCPNNEDLPILPITAPPTVSPGASWKPFVASYDHASEAAHPGSYAVTLEPGHTRVELTATTRTGLGRFTFAPSHTATLLFDATHHATGSKPGSLAILGNDQLAGQLSGGNFCGSAGRFPIFFAARFDRPFTAFGVWSGPTLSPGARTAAGLSAGAYLVFDTTGKSAVQVKIALSYVSAENAWRNLATESRGWSFEATRAATEAAWESLLGRVTVGGGTPDQRRQLYTALFHVFQNPTIASDVNGEYRAYDETVRTAAHVTYQNFSGWDIYRSWIQLMAVLAPRETSDILQSMVEAGEQLGHLPKWTHQNREANVMNGDPGTLIVANGHAFGARDFDARAALVLMNRSGSETGSTVRSGLGSYLRDGHVWDASTTLENTSADFALSRFARALGDDPLAESYATRAGQWKSVFNPATRFIQPRRPDGGWLTPFDPARTEGFTEGNAAQYTFMVPYDLRGLFDALGGNARAVARLDELFRELNAGVSRPHFYIGNEPQFATPWAYQFAGAPAKTEEVVRRILAQSFQVGPGGLPGNDDLGATSSWYVWAALGLYPVIPGTDVLALHGPLFPSVTLALAGGKTLELRGGGPVHVQALRVNGQPTTRAWLRFADLAAGGTLDLTMGDQPGARWGAEPPPSYGEPGRDLARGKRATSSPPCAPAYAAGKAIDGSVARETDKWCSQAPARWLQVDLGKTTPVTGFLIKHAGIRGGSLSDKWCSRGERWLQVDLGARATLTKIVLQHAGAGGENPAWNTRDFKISVSGDGRAWQSAVDVKGNKENVTTHPLGRVAARYLRLDVITPTRNKDLAARIYELQAYDDQGANVAHGKRATADSSCNAGEGPEKAVDGGDEPAANTRDFNLQVSTDGKVWHQVVSVTGNTASQTSHPIPATPARFVRLDVVTPTSDGSPAARIYELEVTGPPASPDPTPAHARSPGRAPPL